MAAPVKFTNPVGGDFVPSGDEAFDKARQALRAFYRLKPHLSAFARVLTGDPKISIEPTGGTSATDGRTIFVRVNPDLAENVPHVRNLCGKRDMDGRKRCAACDAHENVMVPLYHEVAHVAFDSFQKFSGSDLEAVVEAAVHEAGKWGKSDEWIERLKRSFRDKPPSSYLEAAARVSPYLPMLLNAVEDARVNALIHTGNPGMAEMFRIRTRHIFMRGIAQMDGSVTHWKDQPRNAQAVIGTFVKASGYRLEGYLHPDVEADMRDEQLTDLCEQVVHAPDARSVYMLALPILERLRDLGYCAPEKQEEAEPEPEPDHKDTGGDSDDEGDPDETPDSDDFEAGSSGDDEVDGGAGGEGEEAEADDDAEADGESEEDEPFDNGDDDDPEDADPDEDADVEAEGGSSMDDPEGDDESDDTGGDGSDEAADEGEPDDGDTADHGEATDGAGADSEGDEASEDGSPSEGAGGSPEGAGDAPSEDMGTPDDVDELLKIFGEHENDDEPEPEQPEMDKAIHQDRDFDSPSTEVNRANVVTEASADSSIFFTSSRGARPIEHAPEAVIQKCLGPIRVAFSENKKASFERNRKAGRVNASALGKRVPVNDPRLFQKKRLPGKRDYEVLIGLDVSGSTGGGLINLIKAAAWAQAELLSRVGVPFRMYAHTGTMDYDMESASSRYGYELKLDIGVIKDINEPWSEPTKDRLARLKSASANLDGHTMEFYRKRLEESRATKKILMYYTDGAMPAENYYEEKEILERECRLLKGRPDFEVIGVGVRNDDPTQYGLDTVRIDRIEDVHLVVEELRKRLAQG